MLHEMAISDLNRRELLKGLAALFAAAGVEVLDRPVSAAGQKPMSKKSLVGIQIAPHSFYDEGIDYCLDLLREKAAVNALLISCYSYYGAMGRPLAMMADHGVPKKDNAKRKLPVVWVQHHEEYFADTCLRHAAAEQDRQYANRDVLAELAEPARKRDMRLFVRIYEPGGQNAQRHIAHWSQVVEIDHTGKPRGKPCLNHPDFRAWTVGTVRDLFENYPLQGIQYGAERSGPLGAMLVWDESPHCFCQFCLKRAKQKGIDAERARRGFTELQKYLQSLRQGAGRPGEGVLVAFLGVLVEYPEILAWERQWHLANGEVHQLIYDAVKKIRPRAEVGRHVSHVETCFDPFYRAAAPWAEMAAYCDFIKPIMYHEIFGPRLRGYMENVRKTILRDFSLEQCLDLFYTLYGHEPKHEPSLAQLDEGLSPEYVYRETKRAADALAGKAHVYPGIGLDIPKGGGWGTEPWQSDPQRLCQAVHRAFDAGAAGIVISREYEENGVESLTVVGRAVRAVAAARD